MPDKIKRDLAGGGFGTLQTTSAFAASLLSYRSPVSGREAGGTETAEVENTC
jgi:hypothetical protein